MSASRRRTRRPSPFGGGRSPASTEDLTVPPPATPADLYDPLSMPADLAHAHAALDRAVDRCYRPQPFPDERRRFEHLFALHERLAHPLTAPGKKTHRSQKKLT